MRVGLTGRTHSRATIFAHNQTYTNAYLHMRLARTRINAIILTRGILEHAYTLPYLCTRDLNYTRRYLDSIRNAWIIPVLHGVLPSCFLSRNLQSKFTELAWNLPRTFQEPFHVVSGLPTTAWCILSVVVFKVRNSECLGHDRGCSVSTEITCVD